jgi:hypothetical protein
MARKQLSGLIVGPCDPESNRKISELLIYEQYRTIELKGMHDRNQVNADALEID